MHNLPIKPTKISNLLVESR